MGKVGIIDVNILSDIQRVCADCVDLIDYIVGLYDRVLGDHAQIAKQDHCGNLLKSKVDCHGVTDVELLKWFGELSEQDATVILKTKKDPIDAVLLCSAIREGKDSSTVLITNDNDLLVACDHFGVTHYCFKASLWQANKSLGGGIFAEATLNTDLMWDKSGRDPFFHYHIRSRCPKCQHPRTCECSSKTPESLEIEASKDK